MHRHAAVSMYLGRSRQVELGRWRGSSPPPAISLAAGSAEANQLVQCGNDVIACRLHVKPISLCLLEFHGWTRYIYIYWTHISLFLVLCSCELDTLKKKQWRLKIRAVQHLSIQTISKHLLFKISMLKRSVQHHIEWVGFHTTVELSFLTGVKLTAVQVNIEPATDLQK